MNLARFFEKDRNPDRRPKAEQSAEIADQVAEYLRRGGRIHHLPTTLDATPPVDPSLLSTCWYCTKERPGVDLRPGFTRPICRTCEPRRRSAMLGKRGGNP